ncbi:MAG: hypothetical protein ACRDK5_02900 [Solirubrobacterales bacterium]
MVGGEPRKADRKRWARDVVRHLEDFPRQYAALEIAMATFGEDFDVVQFKAAFNATDPEEMEEYNRVQAVERAVGRLQNYVADLAVAGVRLAGLPLRSDGSTSHRAFEALRDAKVIDGELCRRLIRAQQARVMIEHSYVDTAAGDVHRATQLVREAARDFIGRYRSWIEPHLEAAQAGSEQDGMGA